MDDSITVGSFQTDGFSVRVSRQTGWCYRDASCLTGQCGAGSESTRPQDTVQGAKIDGADPICD